MATTLLLWASPILPYTETHFDDTIKSVHAATRKTLLKVKGFSEVKVEKIKEAIAKFQVCLPPCSTLAKPSAVARNMLMIRLKPAFSIRVHYSR